MRFRTIAIASALAAGLVSSTFAFAPHKGETPIVAASSRQPRLHRTTGHTAPKTAQLGSLAGWHQVWDRDTDVPLHLWGQSLAYFGSTADATIAAETSAAIPARVPGSASAAGGGMSAAAIPAKMTPAAASSVRRCRPSRRPGLVIVLACWGRGGR